MIVKDLIDFLNTIEKPEEATIMIKDTAAGYREFDFIEDDLNSDEYIIHTKKPKKGK